jgi:hypothetical protein
MARGVSRVVGVQEGSRVRCSSLAEKYYREGERLGMVLPRFGITGSPLLPSTRGQGVVLRQTGRPES